MKVFEVRVQLPEGLDDELAYKLLEERFVRMIREMRLAPYDAAVEVRDRLTGATLFRQGAFRRPPPDAESAAEEKHDLRKEEP